MHRPRIVTGLIFSAAVLVVTTLAMVAPGGTAQASSPPAITVSRTTGLTHGDVVTVTGARLTPGARVLLVQCATAPQDDSGETGCEQFRYLTAGPRGGVSARLTLRDPVYMLSGILDPPEYCRSDICRVFLAWTDRAGASHVIGSPELEFTGSPATISASKSTDLPALRWIRVRGTAFGAEGHTVKIYEAACGRLANEPECFSTLPVRWATVHADGTFTTVYPAKRFMPDGTDCAEAQEAEFFGCQLTVAVLDRLGRRDNSFGVSGRGEPRADLSFSSS